MDADWGKAIMELLAQLRSLMAAVDPALLTHDDRRALLALIERSFDAATVARGQDAGLVVRVAPL